MTDTPKDPMEFTVRPIGFVRSARTDVRDDFWGQAEAVVELVEEMPDDSLAGLTEFSHVEVLFVFHRTDPTAVVPGSRHPRNNPAWPRVGIFAQRAKGRPNRLGSTIVRVLGVEGRRVRVAGLDAVDGSPVLDLKPVMTEFLPVTRIRQPAWSRELMRDYWRASQEPDQKPIPDSRSSASGMEVAIRVLGRDDLAVLDSVAPEVFDGPVNQRWAQEFLADPRHHLAVAIVEGRVVGMASGVHYLHPDKAPELWVNEVGVAPTHQNKGIGRRLLQALFARGRELGCTQGWVGTEVANAAARSLYRTVGGIEDAEPFVLVTFNLSETSGPTA